MTIFRFSIAILFTLSGCAQNLPSSDTELGKIARIGNVVKAKVALTQFVDAWAKRPIELRQKLLTAGFKIRARDPDAVQNQCEYFDWVGRGWGDIFEKGMIVVICPNDIDTNVEYDGL